MSVALIASASADGSDANGGVATTGPIDTTGASLLYLASLAYVDHSTGSPTDSQGNTWTPLTVRTSGGSVAVAWYCLSPSTSAAHVFSVPNRWSALSVSAWSGVEVYALDQQAGATAAGVSSLSLPSLTPAANGALAIVAACFGTGSSYAADSGFAAIHSLDYVPGVAMGCLTAYKVVSPAAPTAPGLAWSGATEVAAGFVVFSPTVLPPPPSRLCCLDSSRGLVF